MTRGLYPPSSLSKDDIKTMNNVRMDIWSNALTGLVFGSSTGLVTHTGLQWANKAGILKAARMNRNTLFMAVLGGGALGSFVFATAKGKESVHKMHSIFQVGATTPQLKKDDESSTTLGYYKTTLRNAIEGRSTTMDDDNDSSTPQSTKQQSPEESSSFRKTEDSNAGHWVEGDGKLLTDSGVPVVNNSASKRGT